MTATLQRDLTGPLLEALEDLPAVVLTGMRQTGKTTLLESEPALAARRFVTLDDFAQFSAATHDPEGFLAGDAPLTIDEAQRVPKLLIAVKRAIDRDRRPGRFLLSGSAQFGLLSGTAESLAGRALYLTLHPLTWRERCGAGKDAPALVSLFESGEPPDREALDPVSPQDMLLGGLPRVCLAGSRAGRLWLRGYEQTYLERDVLQISRIGDLSAFRTLLKLVALRTGNLLNLSQLARDARMNVETATRHLSVMEASFVVRRLEPYLGNRATRVTKTPKIYLSDTALAAHLCGVDDIGPAADEPMRGALVETFAFHNLAGLVQAFLPGARLSYWNVQGRHEVDFVIEQGRHCLAIEVKAGATFGAQDLAGLKAFLHHTPSCRAGVLAYGGRETVPLGDRLWAVPIAKVLS